MANEIFKQNIGEIAVKVESTEGTAETPVASDLFLAEEIVFKPNITLAEREPVRLYMSDYTDIPGGRNAVISFRTLLKGSGVAGTAPEFGDLFKGVKK